VIIAEQDAFHKLDAYIGRSLPFFNAPGVVIGLTDCSAMLHVGAHGFADLAARKPVEAAHLFEIGSISKSFISILLLQLQARGLIDVHDPVARYLPWFEVRSGYAEPIRLCHLMTHSAGLIRGNDATVSALCEIWSLRETETGAPPGEFFHYSNSGYKILGLVLGEVLGQGLADILRENILAPLGMQASEPVITHHVRGRLATGYEAVFDDRPLPRGGALAPATWLEFYDADGSICSNAEDMCRYLRMLLNRGAGVLDEGSFEALIQPRIATDDGQHGEQYGYGLVISTVDGRQHIGHGGGMVGYYTYMAADLDAGLGAIVLTNGPGEPEALARYALSLLRAARTGEILPEPPLNDPSISEHPQDYAGLYRAAGASFALRVDGQGLILEYEGESIPLERHEKDTYLADHPAFERFYLQFNRVDGAVVEAFHGDRWYSRAGCTAAPPEDPPPEWEAYPGHYRSHNPWYSNFRVVLRKGRLWLYTNHTVSKQRNYQKKSKNFRRLQ